jgi:haloalkane dehalogenase
VRDALRTFDKPALVVWGAEDPVLPLEVAQLFMSLLPNAHGPVAIRGASHFLQEDKPDEVAAAINAFLAR